MTIDEVIKDENWISARFGKNYKEYALKKMSINEIIDIAIRNGRKVEVLEESLNDCIEQNDTKQEKIDDLKITLNTSFDQCTDLIKQNDKMSSDFAGYRIKHPSYESDVTCQSCGTSARNCIC